MTGDAFLLYYLDNFMEPLRQQDSILSCRGLSEVLARGQVREFTFIHPAGHMLVLIIVLVYAWPYKLVLVIGQRFQKFLLVHFSISAKLMLFCQ